MKQEKIGKFIKEKRLKKNLTQSEFANILGVTERTVSNWENGKNLPDLSLYNDICKILNITTNELINGMDLKKKIIIFIFEIIVCLIFTMILFNISSLGIEYPNSQSREIALKILVTIFTPMNGIILLPNITRLINESQNGEIDKEECARKLKKTLIIFILLVIMEFVYLRNTQIGILNNYNMQN